MLYKDDEFKNGRDDHSEQEQNKPNAYRIDDDNNTDEKNLVRSMIGNDERRPVREGKPMGGQNFGANNVTPSGDDPNNPSQNAGYTNEYFRRTQPAEEHPEKTNFKPGEDPKYQQGTADADGQNNAKPNIPGPNELTDQQKVAEDDDEAAKHIFT